MTDLIVLVLLIAVFSVAWIEVIPRRYSVVLNLLTALMTISAGIRWAPNWYGWLVLAIGLAGLAAAISLWPGRERFLSALRGGSSGLRQIVSRVVRWLGALASMAKSSVNRYRIIRRTSPGKENPRVRKGNWPRAFALIIASPVAAIPATLVLVLLLTMVDLASGDFYSIGNAQQSFAKFIFGRAFVTWLISVGIVFNLFHITVPLLCVMSYYVVTKVRATSPTLRYQKITLLAPGLVYPSMFMVASMLGWLNEPFYN